MTTNSNKKAEATVIRPIRNNQGSRTVGWAFGIGETTADDIENQVATRIWWDQRWSALIPNSRTKDINSIRAAMAVAPA